MTAHFVCIMVLDTGSLPTCDRELSWEEPLPYSRTLCSAADSGNHDQEGLHLCETVME